MRSFAAVLLRLFSVLVAFQATFGCNDLSTVCEERKRLCGVSAYVGLMFKVCRSKCDWCNLSLDDAMRSRRVLFAAPAQTFDGNTTTSSDVTPEDVEGSGSLAPDVNCTDTSRSCLATAALCTTPSYAKIMSSKCPKTCKIC